MSSVEKKRGKLIVLEGIDKAGKSTLAQFLHENIPGSVLKKSPNRNNGMGKLLDAFLKNKDLVPAGETTLGPFKVKEAKTVVPYEPHAIRLLFIANLWEEIVDVKAQLEAGHDVIMDRYIHTNIAYSGAQGLDMAWCKTIMSGLPDPDVIVYLRIDAKDAAKRDGFGDERFENVELLSKASANFDCIFHEQYKGKVVIVNALNPLEETCKHVLESVKTYLWWWSGL